MLRIAGLLCFVFSLGHLLSLFWAKQVFEAGGIGKEMNELSQIQPLLPYILTIIVAIGLFIFGLYAFSADGKILKLPLLKFGIFGIASIFIIRAFMGIVDIFLKDDISIKLELVYSLGAFIIGMLYLLGGLKKWRKHLPKK